ncbi:MAG: hypothetical protein O3C40_25610 [Planctomycetota bacterium]|nr:hypothetical protein [Planctomycetota bacterium]
MEAPLTSPTSYRIDSIEGPLPRIARQTLFLGTTLVVCLCIAVVARGLLGAFEAPQSANFLMLVAVTAEVLASLFRVVWLRLHSDATRRRTLVGRFVIPSICVLCVAVAMSLTQANHWAVGSLWLVIAGGELAWWRPAMRSARLAALTVKSDANEPVEEDDEPIDAEEELGANVMQQVTRSRNDDGVEVISGVLRAEFAPGERTHNLHVAFCPPLAYEPNVVAHQLDGSPLIIRVAQSEIFGARIELRRAAAAVPTVAATIYFEVQPS